MIAMNGAEWIWRTELTSTHSQHLVSFASSSYVRLSVLRLKIVLLSGLCLLGVIVLIVSMNFYETNQNDELVSTSSSKMLTDSVQTCFRPRPPSRRCVQETFGESLLVVTALAGLDQGHAQHGGQAFA